MTLYRQWVLTFPEKITTSFAKILHALQCAWESCGCRNDAGNGGHLAVTLYTDNLTRSIAAHRPSAALPGEAGPFQGDKAEGPGCLLVREDPLEEWHLGLVAMPQDHCDI